MDIKIVNSIKLSILILILNLILKKYFIIIHKKLTRQQKSCLDYTGLKGKT